MNPQLEILLRQPELFLESKTQGQLAPVLRAQGYEEQWSYKEQASDTKTVHTATHSYLFASSDSPAKLLHLVLLPQGLYYIEHIAHPQEVSGTERDEVLRKLNALIVSDVFVTDRARTLIKSLTTQFA